MKFKDLFDKEMLVEQHIRKQLKIIYEIDMNLIKPQEESPEKQQSQEAPQQPVQQSEATPAELNQPVPAEPVTPDVNVSPVANAPSPQELGVASVVTEEDTEEKVERKMSGEVVLNDSEKDNIQSFEDIIDILSKKEVNGDKVFDDFCVEVITLCCNQKFQELQATVDKKSKIFVEIYFGYNKDDSVGVRFSKRPNSDLLTSTILIDNEIVTTKFSIERVNQRIIEFRNYEAKRK